MATDPTSSALRGRSVLVTGASGFLGARLVQRLAAEGAQVTAAIRNPHRAARLAGQGVRVERIDLGKTRPDALVAGQEIVFNLAYDFKQSEAANLAGFRNLAEACAKAGVKRFVQVSSIAVYDAWPAGDLSEASPCDAAGFDYKNAKRAMERDLLARTADASLPSVLLQPTLVYGPGSALWTDRFAEQLAEGSVVLPNDGKGLCNAVHVDEVVDALILAATKDGAVGETFIVSGAQPMTWGDFLGSYAAALGRPEALRRQDVPRPTPPPPGAGGFAGVLANPMSLANWGPVKAVLGAVQAALGDGAIERVRGMVKRFQARNGPPVYYPDAETFDLYTVQGRCGIDKARRLLGYAPPTDPSAALQETGAYVRRRYGATEG